MTPSHQPHRRTFSSQTYTHPFPPSPENKALRFDDSYAPSGLQLRFKLGPRDQPTMIMKISIDFEPGKLPRVKVKTKRPRERSGYRGREYGYEKGGRAGEAESGGDAAPLRSPVLVEDDARYAVPPPSPVREQTRQPAPAVREVRPDWVRETPAGKRLGEQPLKLRDYDRHSTPRVRGFGERERRPYGGDANAATDVRGKKRRRDDWWGEGMEDEHDA